MTIDQINNLRTAAGLPLLPEFPALDILIGEEGKQELLGLDTPTEELNGNFFLNRDLKAVAFFPKWTRFYMTDDLDDLSTFRP